VLMSLARGAVVQWVVDATRKRDCARAWMGWMNQSRRSTGVLGTARHTLNRSASPVDVSSISVLTCFARGQSAYMDNSPLYKLRTNTRDLDCTRDKCGRQPP